MIISLSGTSGSGKSTIIRYIKKSYVSKGKDILIKKEDDFFSINLLKSIFGKGYFDEYKQVKFFYQNTRSFKSKLFSSLVYWFYPILVYFEFLFEHVLYEHILRNKIVLRDRYIYDYVVTFKHVIAVYNPLAQFLFSHFPKPSVAFYIQINLDTALVRNKNNIVGKITYDPDLHRQVIREYEDLAKKYKLIVIQNNANLDKCEHLVEEFISFKLALLKIHIITLSGIDGSGKTSLANNLQSKAVALGINCYVCNIFYQNMLYKLAKKFGLMNTKLSSSQNLNQKYPLYKAIATYLDSYIQYLFIRITHPNGIIIFDRFFYDYLVSFEYLGVGKLSFFEQTIPKVHSSFILISNPEVAIKRKQEATLDYYEKSHELYSKLAKDYNIKAIEVDGKSVSQISQELVESI